VTKTRVLVVDDEERIRTLYRRWLVRAGYDVIEAGSGSEAMQALLLSETRVKLVITDRNMPSGSGEELIRAVQATWPTMPIVVVTGFGGDLRTSVPVIEKPVNGPRFLEAIERVLAAS
jgi:DNA-binding NtrC family response regulator